MSTLTITRSIPLPEPKKDYKSILEKMRVGDSFEIKNSTQADQTIRTALYLCSRNLGIKVTVRKARDRKNKIIKGKYRVWRTK